jgi:hypothetical protein
MLLLDRFYVGGFDAKTRWIKPDLIAAATTLGGQSAL